MGSVQPAVTLHDESIMSHNVTVTFAGVNGVQVVIFVVVNGVYWFHFLVLPSANARNGFHEGERLNV